jgi:nucleoid-associated protein YgaU
MSSTYKLLLAGLVIAGGILGAVQFRRQGPVEHVAPGPGDTAFGDPVTRRLPNGRIATQLPAADSFKVPTAATPVAGSPHDKTASEVPRGPLSPVGSLLKPELDAQPVGFPIGRREGGQASDAAPRTHTIEDGDTLTLLAERYLGNPDRFREIYDLNRNVLDNPDVLPIGQSLKLPAADSKPASSNSSEPDSEPRLPLVPVPKGALDAGGANK